MSESDDDLVIDFSALAKTAGPDGGVSIEVKGGPIIVDVEEYARAYAKARQRLLNKHMREAGLPAPSTLKGDRGRKRSRRMTIQLWAGLQTHFRTGDHGFEIYLKGRYRDRSRQRFINKRLKTWGAQFAKADSVEAFKRAKKSLIRRDKKRKAGIAAVAAAGGDTP